MKYISINVERLARREPCVEVRDEDGNVEIVEKYSGFGWHEVLAPPGEPLTPKGPAAWVKSRNLLTVGNVRCLVALGNLAIWGLVIWALGRWV